MRVMPDTCILFSALLWPASKPASVLSHVIQNHDLILCDTIITEIYDVITRKSPEALPILDIFFSELTYTLVKAESNSNVYMDDPKDQPIINAAIAGDVDLLISSDKHFLRLDILKPRIVTVNKYMNDEMKC